MKASMPPTAFENEMGLQPAVFIILSGTLLPPPCLSFVNFFGILEFRIHAI
jgi:hypothetical protein